MDDAFQNILQMLEANGFILMNENNKYLSICAMGGGWHEAIRLIDERKAFLTKLIDEKSTFISPKLYYAVKACQGLPAFDEEERLVYEFIEQNEPVGTKFIKACLPIQEKELDKALKTLQNKLLVTAIGEERRLNENWGSYLWGTAKTWERGCSDRYEFKNPREVVEKQLSGKISDKKLRVLVSME